MQVEVSGVHIDIGDSLKSHVEESLHDVKDKYFDQISGASVFFTKEKHLFKVEVHMSVGRGIMLKGSSESEDAYSSFDKAVSRLSKRLRKYKSKLRDHHNRENKEALQAFAAKDYTIETGDSSEELPANSEPVVVAEMETIIEDLTVSEAVMRLELGDLPALLFKNRADGKHNMIYRREDGNIGWVDPKDA